MERLDRLPSRRHGVKTYALIVFVAAMLSIWLTGCGDNSTPATNTPVSTNPDTTQSTPTSSNSSGGAKADGQQVGITLTEWSILPANLSIPPGSVTFVVTNNGQASHNLTISGPSGVLGQTPDFTTSQSPKSLTLNLQAGTYTMTCSIPGHSEKGMTGTITVK